MWTLAEIAEGSGRLAANKLKPTDVETLDSVFRMYLKNRYSAGFSDLPARLAALTDTNDVKTAAKLAATLISLEKKGFRLSEMKGGRSGLQTNNTGEMVLKIRLALTLLGYELPEEFSGAVEAGTENIGTLPEIPSVSLKQRIRW